MIAYRALRRRSAHAAVVMVLTLTFAGGAPAAPADDCNAPPAAAQTTVQMPGHPFMSAISPDGCTVFVSVSSSNPRSRNGIAVMRRSGGTFALLHVAPLESSPAGLSLTRDGRVLAVADDEFLVFLDTARLIAGTGDPVLGYVRDGPDSGTVDAAISPDDRYVFATDEGANTITVVDLQKTRAGNFASIAVVGRIPVENAPTRMTFSPNGKTLYVPSEVGLRKFGDPNVCTPEGGPADAPPSRREGVLLAIDVPSAERDPEHAQISRVLAGCSPVRVSLSPDGGVAWVSVRHGDKIVAFDTAKMRSDPAHAKLADVPVGKGPVGLAVVRRGTLVLAANADRFAADQTTPRTLSVIDTAKALHSAPARVRDIQVGIFPRDITQSADGRQVILANYGSDSLTLFDAERLGGP
jgi:DNA-binding beta-propeller fold protein YncE